MPEETLIVRAELPTPDIVVVRRPGGDLVVIAHPAIPEAEVQRIAAAGTGALVGCGVAL